MLADGFSLEFEWQQVSSSLHDSSQDSGRSKQCCLWIVSTRPPISNSSRPFNNPLVIAPNAPITIGTIISFMFHSFFNSLASRGTYPSFHFPSNLFYGPPGQQSRQFCRFFFFFFWLLWGLVFRPGLVDRSLCESFSRTGAGLCIYHLFVWSNWNFLHIPKWITWPTQSCLALYSFCANLLHSLIMWLIVSSPQSLDLLFCCVLSILALIWLVLMALSCAAIRRDSVSL